MTCSGGQGNLGGGEIPETASMTVEYPENYIAVFTLGYKAMKYHTTIAWVPSPPSQVR